jgi:hypothetical protein
MEAYLRQWQQHCLDRQQWDAAMYVGDKLLALTSKMAVDSVMTFSDP